MKEIDIKKYECKPFVMFSNEWMALSAGNNAMTIAWGHFGSLWERETHDNRLSTMIVYVRPSRYTKQMLEKNEYFSLCTFNDKKILGYLGSRSGKREDKIKGTGLTPVYDQHAIYYKEAKEVFILKKLYHASLEKEGFCDPELVAFNYPQSDFHEMYVGEVIKIMRNENS